MKSMPLPLLLATLAMSACGAATSSMPSASTPASDRGAIDARQLVTTGVTIQGATPASTTSAGLATDVTLGVEVPCYAQIETLAATALARGDGQLDLAATASFSQKKPVPGESFCLSIRLEMHHLTVPGSYALASIHALDLTRASHDPIAIPTDTAHIATFDALRVTKVAPLCAAGATCAVTGTSVTLETEAVSCDDSVGPVTFAATRDATSGKLHVTASAIHFLSARATGCATAPQALEIALPGETFDSLESVALTNVRNIL